MTAAIISSPYTGSAIVQHAVTLPGGDVRYFITLSVEDAMIENHLRDGYVVLMGNKWAFYESREVKPHFYSADFFDAFDLEPTADSYDLAIHVATALGYRDLADARCACCDDYRELCTCRFVNDGCGDGCETHRVSL